MNKLINAVKNAPRRAGLAAVIASVVLIPAVLNAWGPSRPTYTMEQPADHVTFNSITNNPNQGDEREFVSVSDLTARTALGNSAKLVPGHEYKVQIYVHNNASDTLNASGKGVAIGTKVQSKLPTSVNGTAKVAGYVYADNAAPKEVYDTAELTSDENVELEIVPGSVYLSTHAIDRNLADSLVTLGDVQMPLGGGVLVGSNALDGKWYGCMQYAGVVVYKFRVKGGETPTPPPVETPKNPAVTIDKTASRDTVKVNEEFTYTLTVKNTGDVDLKNVSVSDTQPKGITFVKASKGQFIQNATTSAFMYTIPSLSVGASEVITITAKVNEATTSPIKNTACVNTSETTQSPDDCDDATVTVEQPVTEEPKKETEKVCELLTKKIITINVEDFDSAKHSRTLSDCDTKPVVKDIVVCEIATGNKVTIKENAFDATVHTKDMSKCEPVTPAPTPKPDQKIELPTTGPADVVMSLTGVGALASAVLYYLQSRRSL